ncbi:transcription termination factor Rho [Eggerthella sinensis]|uniref:transcription termination factor Rho n=1 Tax=Eggerthella sinensis TaxID=242230 RepID=UPI00266C4D2C|nr:transcription termination factor Rho [Eggerthella sinensis]
MSENEAAPAAPAAAPTRRRSTSVNAKASNKADAPTPGRNSSATRTPRKSVKAGGAQQQGSGSGNRRQNSANAGKANSNAGNANNNGGNSGNSNRQKQGGGQNKQNNQGNKQNNQNQNHRRQRRPYDNNRGGNREVQPSVSREELGKLKVAELREKAAELNLDVTGLKKAELVEAVFGASVKAEGFIEVSGILDILADGYGFLRTQGYLPSETDCYVGLSTIRRNGLRKGDLVTGQTRPARENEKYAAIQKVTAVNGTPVEEQGNRVRFGDLTPVYPDECLTMEHGKTTVTARVIDLVSPIGKGQRGLIVSPPKAGKTTILKDIAAAISANNPEVHLMCLLVDERPEEVTDMERSIKGEVISSTFDMPTENHIAVSELVIERAKRLVECGKDVVVLLDSLTRLARAYNLAQPASGRILSGGVDSTALYPPKRFLGAARNIEGGGSLTILASALVDTGSKMDEVIFEEFKGTGNMELKLDRNLADRRIFPAIDPVASGTRKEELLLEPQEAPLIWAVRRILSNTNSTERAMDMLIKSLKQTETNQEFLVRTAKKAQHSKADGTLEF